MKLVSKIRKRNRLSQFYILLSFLVTFALVRLVTHLQRLGIIPNQQGIFHLHHLVPGIILVLIIGYIGISYWSNTKIRSIIAVAFGIGAALTIDEFALWLFLKDVYWEKQGRDSIDAVIIVATLLTIAFLISEAHGHSFIKKFIWKRR